MRVLLTVLVAAALCGWLSAGNATGEDCCTDEATVSLSIETYCDVHFLEDDATFELALSEGATEGSATQDFFAGANVIVWLSGELVPPVEAPGTWSCNIDGTEPPSVITFGPGIYDGPCQVNVSVTDIDPFETPAGEYSGGTMTLTLTVDP